MSISDLSSSLEKMQLAAVKTTNDRLMELIDFVSMVPKLDLIRCFYIIYADRFDNTISRLKWSRIDYMMRMNAENQKKVNNLIAFIVQLVQLRMLRDTPALLAEQEKAQDEMCEIVAEIGRFQDMNFPQGWLHAEKTWMNAPTIFQ